MNQQVIHSHRDLIVWQRAMQLVIHLYKFTEKFPSSEKFGLISQMRRCAVSIPSNIAEGRKRGSRKDYKQFLLIAYGSGAELETQLEIAQALKYGNPSECVRAIRLLDEVMRMLNKMTTILRS